MQEHEFIHMQVAERLFCPYCEDMEIRLQRLKVIDTDGAVHKKGIKALSVVLVTSLYESLLELGEDVTELQANLSELYQDGDYAGMYLYLCLLYGLIGESVPQPLQWLASHRSALREYCTVLLDLQSNYMKEDGLIEDDEDKFVSFATKEET